jgi:hypothetical protein
MSFADSMNSLDAMNVDDVMINEIRLPSIRALYARIVSRFQPGAKLGQSANRQRHLQQSWGYSSRAAKRMINLNPQFHRDSLHAVNR